MKGGVKGWWAHHSVISIMFWITRPLNRATDETKLYDKGGGRGGWGSKETGNIHHL